jgi:MFS transporter, DHA2 family, lincomycin resistance protein
MTATAGVDSAAGTSRRDRLVIGTLLVAAFVVILNETIMGVALPRLMRELGVTAALGQWLTTAFMLTMAVVIPTTGFLLQRLSTRTVYALSLGLFSAGTALATVAPGFWVLLLGRIVQASGTALMLPLLMTTVLTLVPPQRRGVVMGNISIAISVAPAIGPTLSGLILQFLSWRFMFGFVLPIAVLALLFGLRMLPNINEPRRQTMDLGSVLLTVPAFGGIVFGLSQLGEAESSVPWLPPASLVVGVATLVVFLRRQRALERGEGPLLDLRVMRYPAYRLSLALLCLAMTALFGTVILLPIYLQNVRGLGSLATGLLLLPGGLLMGLAGPVVGRLFDRHGPRVLTVPGSSLLVVCMLGLTQVGGATPIPVLLGLHLIFMLGLALLFTPSFTTGLNPLPPNLYSHGSAIITTLQQVAGAAGTALLVTIMTLRSAGVEAAGAGAVDAQLAGLHAAFGTAAGIAAVAIVLSCFLPRTGASDLAASTAAEDPVPVELR